MALYRAGQLHKKPQQIKKEKKKNEKHKRKTLPSGT